MEVRSREGEARISPTALSSPGVAAVCPLAPLSGGRALEFNGREQFKLVFGDTSGCSSFVPGGTNFGHWIQIKGSNHPQP